MFHGSQGIIDPGRLGELALVDVDFDSTGGSREPYAFCRTPGVGLSAQLEKGFNH